MSISVTSMEIEESPCPPPYVADLFSEDVQKLQYAVEKLKNTVIGSNRQKAAAIRHGVLPRVLDILSHSESKIEIRRDACVIIGSLVKGTIDNVRVVVNANAVPKLIEVLIFPDEKLVEFALHALTTIFSYPFCETDILFSDQALIPHLLSLMNRSVANQISVATILAHSCSTEEQQIILCQSGVIENLASLLCSSNPKVQMPAVKCLSALSYKNENVAVVIVTTLHEETPIPDLLIQLIARDKSPRMQLNVARCLTNLHRANALLSTDPKISMKTLSCLVRICGKEHDVECRVMAAETLAYLIEIDKDLQAIAAISNHLIPTLVDYLKSSSLLFKTSGAAPNMTQAAFLALASLAANDELIRKRIIEIDNVMEKVVAGLDDSNELVSLAAVKCLHSLSRSVQQLRTSFKDHTVWKPLLCLLEKANQDIRNVAASTLCNLLLEFSPSKEPILEAGALDILSGLTRHDDSDLRINGVWALMNVAFQADQRVKSQIVSCIGTEQIFRLLSDKEDNVVMKTLGLLRNLLSPAADIDYIMGLYGKQIMQASILTLESEHHGVEVKEQVLCMLANISDGGAGKDFLMSNDEILKKLSNYLVDPNSKLQIGAVLCITHLAWKEEDGSAERQAKLKEIGVPTRLHQLITTSDQCLFDRVKTALNQFSAN